MKRFGNPDDPLINYQDNSGPTLSKLYYYPQVYFKISDLHPRYFISVDYITKLKNKFPNSDRIPNIGYLVDED